MNFSPAAPTWLLPRRFWRSWRSKPPRQLFSSPRRRESSQIYFSDRTFLHRRMKSDLVCLTSCAAAIMRGPRFRHTGSFTRRGHLFSTAVPHSVCRQPLSVTLPSVVRVHHRPISMGRWEKEEDRGRSENRPARNRRDRPARHRARRSFGSRPRGDVQRDASACRDLLSRRRPKHVRRPKGPKRHSA
jgi:hypothetical protein